MPKYLMEPTILIHCGIKRSVHCRDPGHLHRVLTPKCIKPADSGCLTWNSSLPKHGPALLLFKEKKTVFVSMGVFPACMPVPRVCLRKPEESVGSPGTRVTDAVTHHMGAGIWTWVLHESSLSHPSRFPIPWCVFLLSSMVNCNIRVMKSDASDFFRMLLSKTFCCLCQADRSTASQADGLHSISCCASEKWSSPHRPSGFRCAYTS